LVSSFREFTCQCWDAKRVTGFESSNRRSQSI